MNKKAIDVVLLPSEEMMDTAITINQELLKRGEPKKMVLNKTDCLPHISLLMGCVADTQLPQITQLLEEIASRYTVFHLQVAEVQQEGSSTVLNMQKNSRLQNLHESMIEQFKPFLTYDAVAEMLYNPAEAGQSSIDYINSFLSNASYGNYSPHITVGSGAYQLSKLPMLFTAGTLAICHLGSHCTCRKILYEVQLNR
jgi:2'-5' RNA ligase